MHQLSHFIRQALYGERFTLQKSLVFYGIPSSIRPQLFGFTPGFSEIDKKVSHVKTGETREYFYSFLDRESKIALFFNGVLFRN